MYWLCIMITLIMVQITVEYDPVTWQLLVTIDLTLDYEDTSSEPSLIGHYQNYWNRHLQITTSATLHNFKKINRARLSTNCADSPDHLTPPRSVSQCPTQDSKTVDGPVELLHFQPEYDKIQVWRFIFVLLWADP